MMSSMKGAEEGGEGFRNFEVVPLEDRAKRGWKG